MILPLSLLFLVLYLLLFPLSTAKEFIFKPVWSLDVDATSISDRLGDTGSVYWYRMGDEFGFVDLEGNIALREKVLFDAALSDSRYINFSRVPENLVLRNSKGQFVRSFRHTGYPMLNRTGERIFILNGESTGLTVVSVENEELWTVEFSTLITSLCYSEDYVLLGLLNGQLKLYNNRGELVGDYSETDSRIPIILGCALSPTGRDIISVSGIDPQKLFFIHDRENGTTESYVVNIASDYRREVFIRFSGVGRRVYFEFGDGFGIFDIRSKRVTTIPFRGTLIGTGETEQRGIVSVLSENDYGVQLRLCTMEGEQLYFKAFECEDVYLRHIGTHILLGCDRTLLRVDIVEE
jgi:hypothetical protein